MDPDLLFDILEAEPKRSANGARPTPRLADKKAMAWKVAILAVTTLAFVPVLLSRNEHAGTWYVAALVAVHVAGLAVLLWKTPKGTWNLRDPAMWLRIAALGILALLLSWVGKGLTEASGTMFWLLLAGIWLLHTAGVVLLHLRGRDLACPFLPSSTNPM